MFFEGHGEAIFWRDKLLLGVGFAPIKKQLAQFLKSSGSKLYPCSLSIRSFIIWIPVFFALNSETAFFILKLFPKVRKMLQKVVPQLFAFTNNEVTGFAANSIVTDHHVLINTGCPSFTRRIRQLGYEAQELKMSEFVKSGGSIHCLTQVLSQIIY